MRLTRLQIAVLAAAVGLPIERDDANVIPKTVYRSLVIRGLLVPDPRGYAITQEGRDALRG